MLDSFARSCACLSGQQRIMSLWKPAKECRSCNQADTSSVEFAALRQVALRRGTRTHRAPLARERARDQRGGKRAKPATHAHSHPPAGLVRAPGPAGTLRFCALSEHQRFRLRCYAARGRRTNRVGVGTAVEERARHVGPRVTRACWRHVRQDRCRLGVQSLAQRQPGNQLHQHLRRDVRRNPTN